MLLQSCLPQFW
ncbi:hypothetical protein MTR67_040012 [Solanum verrucosum]|uniref:Uncharacterized protein n=1 Tax=Solanum verrucosum TaxID=315347 RepID=A0AAF0UI84_SOLVR|nr:hypothetical protein MTR67_040012 [Solanum verrucosum]